MPIRLVMASKIGVEPARIRSYELDGVVYFTWPDSPVVGGQCSSCHTIVWVDQRLDPILNEAKPSEVPESGEGYREYQDGKILRFLASMPACPHCGNLKFDRFINNVNYPRFPNGKSFPEAVSNLDLIKEDPQSALVYFSEGR